MDDKGDGPGELGCVGEDRDRPTEERQVGSEVSRGEVLQVETSVTSNTRRRVIDRSKNTSVNSDRLQIKNK